MDRYVITKEMYIPAPRPHVAVYAMGQTYTDTAGVRLIEEVRLESRNTTGHAPGIVYYSPEIYTRFSEDNGRTWRNREPLYVSTPENYLGQHRSYAHHFRDPENGLLLRTFGRFDYGPSLLTHESFPDAGTVSRTSRPFYQISRDRGLTWEPEQQIIQQGREYDACHWGPGLQYGENGGGGVPPVLKLDDGTLLLPFVVILWDGKRAQSGLLRGRWRADLSGVDWRFSEYISLPLDKSTQGVVEPAVTLIEEGRIFVALRACGDKVTRAFPSLKFWVVSDDGGHTFSEPRPLTYEDGAPVWTPSSYHALIRSSKTRRIYWIGNILPEPTYTGYPRHPLCIAELDPQRLCLLRDSVGTIQALPPGAPERRRYTNFGFYEDRETQEIVLTLPEQPRASWADFTSDCYRYRIRLDM